MFSSKQKQEPNPVGSITPVTQKSKAIQPQKPGIVGMASFFDFLCAVFSRIAYVEDPMTLFLLSGVFKIIPEELIAILSKVTSIKQVESDMSLLASLTPEEKGKIKMTGSNNEYIDFRAYAVEINYLIDYPLKSIYFTNDTDPDLTICSIADSNYGDILVIGTKKLPNFVFVAYRGTYSAKTAASYSKLSSVIPAKVKEAKILKGIGKILLETVYTTGDCMEYIAQTINSLPPNASIIPVFTGHSLGGAMATLMDYEYCNDIEVNALTATYLNKKCICVSFGAPRALSSDDSRKLCAYAVSGNTLIHRYSNNGDPVTALPPSKFGYKHPCSEETDKTNGNRLKVSRDCDSALRTGVTGQTFDYTVSLNCTNNEKSLLGKMYHATSTPFHHTNYLYINFRNAADISAMVGSVFTLKTIEIGRVTTTEKDKDGNPIVTSGDTEIRIIVMEGNKENGIYKSDFIDLTSLRVGIRGIDVQEDAKDTSSVFNKIIEDMKPIQINFNANGLPVDFIKRTSDDKLVNLTDPMFTELLKNANLSLGDKIDPTSVAPNDAADAADGISGGKSRKSRKSRKSKKSRKTKKSKKSRKTRKV